MSSLQNLKQNLNSLKNPEKAKIYQRFFKTGKGEYGEGDVFLGLTVPDQRKLAKKYIDLNLKDLERLLHTNIHEYRLTSLLILTYQFEKLFKNLPTKVSECEDDLIVDRANRETTLGKLNKKSRHPELVSGSHQLNSQLKQIYNFYLANTKWINNWDLVDVTTPKIVGIYLLDKKPKQRKILYKLARSKNLWERRISIMATFPFIKAKDWEDTLNISQILLLDKHDLIHKAVGWMLREIGKIDQKVEESFLMEHYKSMPRTMLRYAIEKFKEPKRQFYLRK